MKRKKNRDYEADVVELRKTLDHLHNAQLVVSSTGAVQLKAKVIAAVKSAEGALRNARGHAARSTTKGK